MTPTRLSDYLRRLRPVAAPGAAGAAGVPADVPALRDAELAPVFAALEDARQEAAAIRDRATDAAATQRRHDAEAAARIAADATREAATARRDAAREGDRRFDAARLEVAARAEQEAEWVRSRAAARVGPLCDRVVDVVWSLADPSPADPGTAPGRADP